MSQTNPIECIYEVRRKIWPPSGDPTFEHIGWFRDLNVAGEVAEALNVADYTRHVDAHFHRDGFAIIDGERLGRLREVPYFLDALPFWRASGLAKLLDEERAALGLEPRAF